MDAVKGFDSNMQCRGYQFSVGGSYKESEAILCNSGFHAVLNPLEVFNFYSPNTSLYATVTGGGKIDRSTDESTKIAFTEVTINSELTVHDLCLMGAEYILSHVSHNDTNTGHQSAATNTGDRSAATNTGDQSAATNAGDQSAATNTGYQSAATNAGYRSAATNTGNQSAATNAGDQSAATNTGYQSAATNTGHHSAATNTGHRSAAIVTGKQSVAMSTGYQARAKGAIGCWIVLAEWITTDQVTYISDVQCAHVDGAKILADTFYVLQDGQFTAVTTDE
ncbi:MAG: DUF7666 domain-containing protein [Thermoplasmataceae archaeon]